MTKPQTQTRISGRNTDATEPNTRADRHWLNLLKAARSVEACSHYDESTNEYHVDPHAMASLCAAIGNRKLSKLMTKPQFKTSVSAEVPQNYIITGSIVGMQ